MADDNLTGSSTNMDSLMLSIAKQNQKSMDTAISESAKRQQDIAPQRAALMQEAKDIELMQPPAPPQMTPPPEMHKTDPGKAFGSFASILGIIASMFTRQPLMNALNASASAMNAIHKNDKEAYDREMDNWKKSTDYALEVHKYQMERYDQIIQNKRLSMNDQLALIQAEAASARDPILLEQARAGSYGQIMDVLKMREQAADKLEIARESFANNMKMEKMRADTQREVEGMRVKAMEEKDAPALHQLHERSGLWQQYQQSEDYKKLSPSDKLQAYNEFWTPTVAAARERVSAAGKDGGMSDQATDIAAYQYLTTGKLPPLGIGDAAKVAKTSVMNRAGKVAETLGMTPAEVAALPGEYKANVGSLVQQVRWRDGVARSSMTVENNINIMRDYAARLDLSTIKTINRAILQGQMEFNDPNANAYAAAAATVMNEYARVMSGPTSNAQLTVNANERAAHLLDQALDPTALEEVGKVMTAEMQGQMKSTDDVIADIKRSMHDVTQRSGRTTGVTKQSDTYSVGQVIERGGKKYKIIGGDMSDPDVEEVQ